MKSLYFLPQWYIEKIKIEKNKKLKFTIILFLIINLILGNIFVINKNKLNDVSDELKKSTLVEKSVYYKSITFESFLNFYKYIWQGRDIKNINVQNKDINFNVEDEEDCFSLIKKIEESDKFIIKDLKCKDITEEKKKIWEINLRLK
ncbi:hypothetical protein AB8U03_04370 [Clostridium sp. Mt-5]|uniref:Uncharacterized protein n=1 Tax=Clostridium moutaii TaxID=3240932 RepID=A0ABV4BLM2_9CLOT